MIGEMLLITRDALQNTSVLGVLFAVVAVSNIYATLYNHHSLKNKIVNTFRVLLLVAGVEYIRVEIGAPGTSISSTVYLLLIGLSMSLGDWVAYLLCKFTNLSAHVIWTAIAKGYGYLESFAHDMNQKAQGKANQSACTNIEKRLFEFEAAKKKTVIQGK